MTINNFPIALIYLAGAIILMLVPRRVRSAAYLVFPVIAFIILLQLEVGASYSISFLNYELVLCQVDKLSLAFGYVFVIMSFLGGIYAFHVKDSLQQVAALLYVGSSLGVVFTGDLLTLLICWEIMAITSLGLIWARRTPDSRKAGFRYLVVHLFGGSVLMAGILMYYNETGSMLFTHFGGTVASYLILIGFALNAAIPPLNGWLPDAYPEGTVTGSVFLSAFTTKVAVYVLARGFAGMEALMWAGAAMAVYGVIFAFLANDSRRLLSYHIISQVGYMVCAVGIGSQMAINGATAHAFAHILYKGLLFMGMGTLLYATGKSKLSELGGLSRSMKLALVLFMVGAFSISGVPLFSGFVSKSLVIHAAGEEHLALIVLLLNLASVGTFLSIALKLPYFAWFGPDRGIKPKPVPRGMYIAMALTGLLCFVIGVYPDLLYNLLPYDIHYQPYTASHLMETFQLIIFTGLAFWLVKSKLHAESNITLDFDWFYRRPAGLAYTVFSTGICELFGWVERQTLRLVYSIMRFGTNPPGYLATAVNRSKRVFAPGAQSSGDTPAYSPDRYRITLGFMVLVVVICLVVIMFWNAFR